MSYFTDKRDAAREDKRMELAHRLEMTRLAGEERRADAEQAREAAMKARAERAETRAAVKDWCGKHIVDLLVYPLMLASAAIAVPSAAAWGGQHLGHGGALLPVLSEWGMVAFSVAVHVSRVREREKPVWALQAGMWAFAAVGFVIAVLRGLSTPGGGLDVGVVMGLVSVAGVAAHQLVTAAPRRTPAEREARRAARRDRRAAREIEQTIDAEAARRQAAQRAAIRMAVAEIDPDGTARLVFRPGRFVLGRRGRLRPDTMPNLEVEKLPPLADVLADEAAAFLAGLDRGAVPRRDRDEQTPPGPAPAGGLATLDPDPDPVPPDTGTPADDAGPAADGEPRRDRPARRGAPRKAARSTIPEPKRRTPAQLQEAFDAALAERPEGFDPTNAESIRRTLRCGKPHAAELKRRYLDRTRDTD